jgi:hypothetical protein
MGTWFEFLCDGCGYQAEVSGGPDAGMRVSVQTMTCRDCAELVDVVTQVLGEGTRDIAVGCCPICHGNHLAEWTGITAAASPANDQLDPGRDGRLCPKCATPMRRGELMTLWD